MSYLRRLATITVLLLATSSVLFAVDSNSITPDMDNADIDSDDLDARAPGQVVRIYAGPAFSTTLGRHVERAGSRLLRHHLIRTGRYELNTLDIPIPASLISDLWASEFDLNLVGNLRKDLEAFDYAVFLRLEEDQDLIAVTISLLDIDSGRKLIQRHRIAEDFALLDIPIELLVADLTNAVFPAFPLRDLPIDQPGLMDPETEMRTELVRNRFMVPDQYLFAVSELLGTLAMGVSLHNNFSVAPRNYRQDLRYFTNYNAIKGANDEGLVFYQESFTSYRSAMSFADGFLGLGSFFSLFNINLVPVYLNGSGRFLYSGGLVLESAAFFLAAGGQSLLLQAEAEYDRYLSAGSGETAVYFDRYAELHEQSTLLAWISLSAMAAAATSKAIAPILTPHPDYGHGLNTTPLKRRLLLAGDVMGGISFLTGAYAFSLSQQLDEMETDQAHLTHPDAASMERLSRRVDFTRVVTYVLGSAALVSKLVAVWLPDWSEPENWQSSQKTDNAQTRWTLVLSPQQLGVRLSF